MYVGSIKLESITSIPEMLSGVGRLQFENGDVYEGRLLFGDMHTNNQEGEIATFTGKHKKYVGQYQYGCRHGLGKLYFKYGGEQYILMSNWEKNKPINPQVQIARKSEDSIIEFDEYSSVE